jgi:hypothetical protein
VVGDPPPVPESFTPTVIREKSRYVGSIRTNAGSVLRYAGEVDRFTCSVTTHARSGIAYATSVATYARQPRT